MYAKTFNLVKPFWKLIIVSLILSLFYIFFNNISLWVSVYFMKEIFDPAPITETIDAPRSPESSSQNDGENTRTEDVDNIEKGKKLYKRINDTIKGMVIQENKFDTLKIICLIVFLSFLFKNMVGYLRRILINLIELRILQNLRDKLYSALVRLPLSFFERNRTGELTSIIFNDVAALRVVLNMTFNKLLLIPLQIIFNLIILVTISWELSLITFTVIPVIAVIITKIGQSIRRKQRRVLQQIANVTSVFQETIASIRIVKAFTSEDREKKKFEAANRHHFKMLYRANRLNYLTSPLNEIVASFILVALLWYGGNMVFTNTGLTGEAFMQYLVFLFTTFQPLKEFSGLNNKIQAGIAASERIFGTIEAHPEVYENPEARSLESFRDGIRFNHVYFSYNENGKDGGYILNDINLDIRNGETVAFVGHSGAGKSTLVDLIPRFYDINEGMIFIDNTDIRELTLLSLRGNIGIVTQESILFNDTIKMNIGYGLEREVSDEEIIEAAKAANAWEFIRKMDGQLSAKIGERGVKLSGGQKQRLSIARAILKNPPILILDEATSALDSESEKLVQEAIDKLMQDRTVLVIAHRLSTVIHADKIVVLENGRIVDIGPHKNLLKSCPAYQKLYEMQFRD